MTSIDLSGGLVLVTGGAGSIGSAIAVQAAQAGASVAVCDLNSDAAERVAAGIRAGGAVAMGFRLDVTDPDAVKQLMPSKFNLISHCVSKWSYSFKGNSGSTVARPAFK